MKSSNPLSHICYEAPAPRIRRPALRVSVIPVAPQVLKTNILFESRRDDHSPHSPNGHWLDCLAEVYKKERESNILFGIADVMPKDEADVLIYMAQPNFITQKLKYPNREAIG